MDLCLQTMLSGSALVDINSFDGRPIDNRTEGYWAEVNVTYVGTNFIGGRLLLGPLNNVDLSAGALLYGLNVGTLERLTSFRDISGSIWDSFNPTVKVDTTIPLLTCQCTRRNPIREVVSVLNIQDTPYLLPQDTHSFARKGSSRGPSLDR